MNSTNFLYTAYAAVWIIHSAYIITLIIRYRNLKKGSS